MKNVAVVAALFRRAPEVFSSSESLGLRCLEAPAEEAELAAFVREHGVAHVIVGTTPYRGQLYAALPKGGVISRFGVGYDSIDLAQAQARGLHVGIALPDALSQTVAELTVALLLAAARRLTLMNATVRQGGWQSLTGTTLAGKTLLLVGCGHIGRRVAAIAGLGLRLRVVGVSRAGEFSDEHRRSGFSAVTPSFETTVPEADFVSLHLPSRPELKHYLNAEKLALLKRGAWLINTARGMLVDEAALFDAISSGHLAGAALDVFEREPYVPAQPDKDLRTLDSVIMTPHAGSNTSETNAELARQALANIAAAEAGDLAAMTRPPAP